VEFQSAASYAKRKSEECPYPLAESTSLEDSHGEPFRHFIRKESCSFAWDWGPAFLPQGIWKSIEILGFSSFALIDVYPQVFNAKDNQFKVLVQADLKSAHSQEGTMKVTVAGKEYSTSISLTPGDNTVSLTFQIPASSIELWSLYLILGKKKKKKKIQVFPPLIQLNCAYQVAHWIWKTQSL